jgi:glycerol-3-phosphate O-acyltransferase/dihydroxyacetone phosphate acyltransferase
MSDARSEEPSDAFPPTSGFVYTCFLAVWKVILNIFFREIRPRGTFNIPREGPVILVVAPHANQVRFLASLHGLSDLIVESQFSDPLLVAILAHAQTGRPTRFIAAAVNLRRQFVGFFVRLMSSSECFRLTCGGAVV